MTRIEEGSPISVSATWINDGVFPALKHEVKTYDLTLLDNHGLFTENKENWRFLKEFLLCWSFRYSIFLCFISAIVRMHNFTAQIDVN